MTATSKHLYRPVLRPASFATLPGIDWDYVESTDFPPIAARRQSSPTRGLAEVDWRGRIVEEEAQ
jgi:hypothetical protein